MGIRIYPNIPRCYFDLDGVLADMDRGAAAIGLHPSAAKSVVGFYAGLPVMEHAQEVVRHIKSLGYDVWALSKCPRENASAATDKVHWVNSRFPEIGEQLILTPDKGCVGTPRDTLVDDHPEWANASAFPGTIFTFKGDWEPLVAMLELNAPGARSMSNQDFGKLQTS